MCLGYKNAFNLQILVFRFFNVFGPNQKPDHPYSAVIPKWALNALKGEELVLYGDGTQVRDFTYVDTVTDIIEEAVSKNISSLTPINLALGNSMPLSELIPIFEDYFGDIKIKRLSSRPGDISVSTSNPTYLRQLFKNIEVEPLNKSLLQTFEWIKKNYS
jgi:UDP-glucose 4-epimerase